MQVKTIGKILDSKFQDFLTSIEDENVRDLVKNNSLISGGCIVSLLNKEPVHDFDIYFTNKETVLAVCEYYAKVYNNDPSHSGTATVVDIDNMDNEDKEYYQSHSFLGEHRVGIYLDHNDFVAEIESEEDGVVDEALGITNLVPDDEKTKRYLLKFISPNAISLGNKVQLITRFYGDAADIHSNYDFVHATNYWLSRGKNNKPELVFNLEAVLASTTKTLIYRGSKYPIASVLRTKKFIQRGWTINAGQYLKMIWQIKDLDLNDMAVLEDQLIGVDVAYFSMLLSAIRAAKKAHQEEGKEFSIDYSYIVEIINRIFE